MTSDSLVMIHSEGHVEVQFQVERTCRCERCARPFTYRYRLVGHGSGHAGFSIMGDSAGDMAFKLARHRATTQLETAVPAFPCPGCGGFQEAMVQDHRRTSLGLAVRAAGWILGIHVVAVLFSVQESARRGQVVSGAWASLLPTAALLLLLLLIRRFGPIRKDRRTFQTEATRGASPMDPSVALVPLEPVPEGLRAACRHAPRATRLGKLAVGTLLVYPLSLGLAVACLWSGFQAVRAFRSHPEHCPLPSPGGPIRALLSLAVILGGLIPLTVLILRSLAS